MNSKPLRNLIASFFLMSLFTYNASGQKPFWDSLPKPIGHINDFEKIFTKTQIGVLERKVSYFEKNNRVQIVVITMDSSNVSLNKFDSLIFRIANYWNVGTTYGDRGVVIGICKGYRAMFLIPGLGLNHIITQEVNQKLMNNYFFPYYKSKRFYEGTYHGINAICDVLEHGLNPGSSKNY